MIDIPASRVLWPDGTLAPGVVRVDGDAIAAVGRPEGPVPERILVPGFVDLQVNGWGDVDVRSASGDDWDLLDAHLLAHGVTTWCPTVTTAPLDDMVESVERIAAASGRSGARPQIAGAHLEGPFLGGAPGAHAVEHVVPPSAEALATLPDGVAVLTLGPEVAGAVEAIRELRRRGVLVALGHSTADLDTARAGFDAGARLATHVFNAMGPLHHRAPGLVGAALTDDRAAVSLIADLVHVHPSVLRLAVRAKPRDRVVLVTDTVATPPGASPGGPGSDVPRRADGTLRGTTLTMDAAVRNLVTCGAADLTTALRAASATPAGLLGLDDRGALAVGRRADIVALDHRLRVSDVWVGGLHVPVRSD